MVRPEEDRFIMFEQETEVGVTLGAARTIARFMPGMLDIRDVYHTARRIVITIKPIYKFWQLRLAAQNPDRVVIKSEPTIMAGRVTRVIVPDTYLVSEELQVESFKNGVQLPRHEV
jgi:hypothetical protein